MSVINVRVNDTVKQDVEALFNSFGMNISTAVNVFFAQCLRERAIPFQIKDIDRMQARQELGEAFRIAQEQSVLNGTDKMTAGEIDAEIAAYRREKRTAEG